MMKPFFLLSVLFSAALASCGGMATDSSRGGVIGSSSAQGSSPYQGRKIQGGLVIMRGDSTVSTIRTVMPNVEEWKFINNGRSVVAKSRASHGPAAVEMFDSATGALQDKVLAFAIKNGQPAWAAEYAE